MQHEISQSTVDGTAVTVLAAPGAGVEAAFAPGAGMVCCSLRHHGEELLGQRGGLAAYVERGSSFGIPLLHPWANRLDGLRYRAGTDVVELDSARTPLRLDEHGLPIHGLLAASPHWEVASASSDGEASRLSARLDFGAHPELLAGFPFPHELVYEAELREGGAPRGRERAGRASAAASLAVRLSVRPTGVMAVPVSFGFHPYLTLPGVAQEEWQVQLPVRRRAILDDRGIPTGETEKASFTHGSLGDLAFDDLFPELDDPAAFVLSGGGRRITVELGSGYPVAQVYSPAGSGFVCFEPMTAPTNALVSGAALPRVAPGAAFTAEFRVSVAEL